MNIQGKQIQNNDQRNNINIPELKMTINWIAKVFTKYQKE